MIDKTESVDYLLSMKDNDLDLEDNGNDRYWSKCILIAADCVWSDTWKMKDSPTAKDSQTYKGNDLQTKTIHKNHRMARKNFQFQRCEPQT